MPTPIHPLPPLRLCSNLFHFFISLSKVSVLPLSLALSCSLSLSLPLSSPSTISASGWKAFFLAAEVLIVLATWVSTQDEKSLTERKDERKGCCDMQGCDDRRAVEGIYLRVCARARVCVCSFYTLLLFIPEAKAVRQWQIGSTSNHCPLPFSEFPPSFLISHQWIVTDGIYSVADTLCTFS